MLSSENDGAGWGSTAPPILEFTFGPDVDRAAWEVSHPQKAF